MPEFEAVAVTLRPRPGPQMTAVPPLMPPPPPTGRNFCSRSRGVLLAVRRPRA